MQSAICHAPSPAFLANKEATHTKSQRKRERDLSDLEAELEELENEDFEPKPKRKRARKKKGTGANRKKEQAHLEDIPLVKERFGDNTTLELRESEWI